MGKLRSKLSYANVMSSIAVFAVLAGGTAWAVDEFTGENIQDGTLTSRDYRNEDIRSVDIRDDSRVGGGLAGSDIAADAVDGSDVANTSSLGSLEINETSLRFACPDALTAVADLCITDHVQGDAISFTYREAQDACADLNMRFPSVGEALLIQRKLGPPDSQARTFFTDDRTSQEGFMRSFQNNAGLITEVSVTGLDDPGTGYICVRAAVRPPAREIPR